MPSARPEIQGRALRYAAVALMVAVITLLHYNTAVHIHGAHGIYRRLYYFPIIFAAFLGGRRAGLVTAGCICLVYIPHAFGWIGFDPAPALEKILEMILYLAVGLVTGILVSREMATRRSLCQTAEGLKQALVEKAAMEDELVRSARLAAVGRLSAGLAHEIRNPLASIQGAAQVLEDDFPPAHPKGRLLQVLLQETARLNGVLSRFLDFARPRRAGRDRIDIPAEVRHVVELVRHRDDMKGIDISPGTFPPAPCTIEADRERIRQLLLNLVLNAAQAAGPAGEVTIACDRADQALECRVTDNGPGFTDEALENFGAPFFTTKPHGTGLGLAVCHRIVEDLGGRISARNVTPRGAMVTFSLPLSARED
jgi:two-component system sensor histidine kinase HydH